MENQNQTPIHRSLFDCWPCLTSYILVGRQTLGLFVLLFVLLIGVGFAVAQNPNTSPFPGALDTDATLLVGNDSVQTTLNGAITATATTINVTSAALLTAFPTSCWVDNEIIKIVSKVSNALTVATDCASGTCPTCSPTTDCRGWGFASTTEASHLTAATFTCGPTAEYENARAAAILAIQVALGVNLEDIGHIKCDSPTELTLDAAGEVTITKSACYTVDTFADAASDGLLKVNCSAGVRFILMPADDARTVVITNGAAIAILADFSLNDLHDSFMGRCFSTDLTVQLSRNPA